MYKQRRINMAQYIKKNGSKQFTFAIDVENRAFLDKISKENRRSISAELNIMISEKLKKQEVNK